VKNVCKAAWVVVGGVGMLDEHSILASPGQVIVGRLVTFTLTARSQESLMMPLVEVRTILTVKAVLQLLPATTLTVLPVVDPEVVALLVLLTSFQTAVKLVGSGSAV
jgi:hypothetical protein